MDITIETRIMDVDEATQGVIELIYSQAHGDIDSKAHRAEKMQAIHDWLTDSFLNDNPTIEALAQEWAEYDAS